MKPMTSNYYQSTVPAADDKGLLPRSDPWQAHERLDFRIISTVRTSRPIMRQGP
jgi:hypothetical protein